MLKIQKQIGYLYTSSVLENLTLTGAWVAILSSRGFSLVEISMAETVFHLVSLLLELPSGILADVFGRKRMLIVSAMLRMTADVAMFLSGGLSTVCISMGLTAASYNFASGTGDALAYDSLKYAGQEGRFDRYESNQLTIYRLCGGLSTLCAGLALTLGYKIAYASSLVTGLMQILALSGLQEVQLQKFQEDSTLAQRLLLCAKESLCFLKTGARALLLMLVPLALLIWQGKQRIEWGHTRWKELLAPLIAALLLQMLTTACILPDTGGAMSASRLYTTDFISNLSVSRFGLLTTFRIEARNAIFGPMPAVGGRTEPEPEPEPEPEAEPQVMDIDFAALAGQTENAELAGIYRYFARVTPCESLWKYAIDPDLTPNLYKLWSEGFQFTEFYNPIWGVSTLDGEYVNLLGLIPVTGTWSLTESVTNWLPFSFGNQFRAMGYTTRAYHDHTYTYYSRNKSHPNLGYDYKGVGNGLNIKVMWPESDVDMMNATLDTVLADEHFMTYYLTVSGHLEYNFFGNCMAMRNEEAVAELDLPEAARAGSQPAMVLKDDRRLGIAQHIGTHH